MNILEKIIVHKREELDIRKSMVNEDELVDSKLFKRDCLSLKDSLLAPDVTGIIAEFKRKSPSKGFINQYADAVKVTKAYTNYGASGLSVLTDNEFFGGNTNDIIQARENQIPILRKDFIIDPYQVLAAKAMGADVILLIAACLSPEEVQTLAGFAKKNGLEVLLELHDESELDHICDEIDIVGINNRNLRTFEVDISRSLKLGKMINNKVLVAESGINSIETIKQFRDAGFAGFLVGETFMRAPDPGEAFKNFVEALKHAS